MFGSCSIHTLYTGCAKIKKNNSGAIRLKVMLRQCQEFMLQTAVCLLGERILVEWVSGFRDTRVSVVYAKDLRGFGFY